MNSKKNYVPNLLENKILLTISYLNELEFYPNSEGVYDILKGVINEVTKEFINCPTFQTIISRPKKRISVRIAMLARYGYLEKVFSYEHNDLYLKVSNFGQSYLAAYLKKSRGNFAKKIKKTTNSIVKIK